MAVFPNSNNYGSRMNPFWLEPTKKDVMGYKIKNVAAGVTIPQGYPLYCVDSNGTKEAYVCKYIEVISIASDNKTLTVKKGSLALSSETYFLSGAQSPTLRTISSVTYGADTDTIVLSAAASEITAGAVLVEGKTSGSSTVVKYVPNRIASQKAEIDALDDTVSAMHNGVVLKNVVNYPSEYINATTYPGSETLVGCPLILFIIQ